MQNIPSNLPKSFGIFSPSSNSMVVKLSLVNIIVLQHIKIEDPGYIKDLMLADGFNLTTIELDEGEKIPDDLSKFDGMFCMGGPMDTYMEQEYPWLLDDCLLYTSDAADDP